MKVFISVLCLFFFGAAYSQDHHWGYDGKEGPDNWGDLENGKLCSIGTAQSPIDITGSKLDKSLPKLDFQYTPGEIDDIVDNGHSLQFDFKTGGKLLYGGKSYTLAQFHAHVESEHTIDGIRYPLELHFVHKADDGAILVIGVMVKEGELNSYFEKLSVFKSLKKEEKMNTKIEFDPSKMFPAKKNYYRYAGSLTTPPCSEGVTWIVFKNPIYMTKEEIADIKQHLPKHNNRPIQSLSGRIITNN